MYFLKNIDFACVELVDYTQPQDLCVHKYFFGFSYSFL